MSAPRECAQLPKLTERQIEAFKKLAQEAAEDWDITIDGYHSWELDFKEEVRPGRGHDVQAFYFDTDQEMFLNVWMDVYGNHAGMAVASFEWVHNPSDEYCSCWRCANQRLADQQEEIAYNKRVSHMTMAELLEEATRRRTPFYRDVHLPEPE